MINLFDCIERGYERSDEELPTLSLYGWAMANLDHEPDEWDESAIHVSDYKYSLDPSEGGCDRQLWHRLRGDEREEPKLYERVMWDQGFAMQIRYTWLMTHGLPEGWKMREVEMDISEGLPADDVGSCDLVLESEDTIVGVEIKTQRGNAFKYGDFPRPSHEIQAQGELYALKNLFPEREVVQRILYCDREGQNAPELYPVGHEPERIEAASRYVSSILVAEDEPDPLDPLIEVRENKGPNSIYLKELWPCSYCSYKGVSCPGALPDELTELGIVAKGDHNGDFDLKADEDIVGDYIRAAAKADNVKTK